MELTPTRNHTWRKKGFVNNIIQTGRTRDAALPNTPTIWELMERYKTPEASLRLANVVLARELWVGRCSAVLASRPTG